MFAWRSEMKWVSFCILLPESPEDHHSRQRNVAWKSWTCMPGSLGPQGRVFQMNFPRCTAISKWNSDHFWRQCIDQGSIAISRSLPMYTDPVYVTQSKMLLFLVLPFLIAGYSSENGSCGFHLALATEPVNLARSFLCTLVPPQTFSITNRWMGQTPATWWMVASTVCPWSQSPQGFLMLPNKKIIIKLVLNKEVEILLYS